jgi:predicted RNA binding protein YcfA (HicA-like mRNA interferase family)
MLLRLRRDRPDACRQCPAWSKVDGDHFVAKKVHEVITVLEANGWREVRQRGSHRQFKHRARPVVITVAGKLGATMPVGQLASIRRKSGIEDLR